MGSGSPKQVQVCMESLSPSITVVPMAWCGLVFCCTGIKPRALACLVLTPLLLSNRPRSEVCALPASMRYSNLPLCHF